MQIVTSLREQGIEISIVGDKLRIAPRNKVTPDILETIQKNKSRIAQELKAARGSGIPKGSFWIVDGQAKPVPSEEIPPIQKLPYVRLKDLPPTALLIYSRALGEHIWLVTSNELTERLQATGKAVYMLEEIARLIEQGLTDPVSIKAFHAVKREFPGSTIH